MGYSRRLPTRQVFGVDMHATMKKLTGNQKKKLKRKKAGPQTAFGVDQGPQFGLQIQSSVAVVMMKRPRRWDQIWPLPPLTKTPSRHVAVGAQEKGAGFEKEDEAL